MNIEKVDRLRAQGRMTAAGEAAFARRTPAKSMVYAYEQTGIAALNAAEQRTFRREPKSWAYFEASPASYRRTMLHWVASAKRPATRSDRLRRLIEACRAGVRLR